MEVSESGEALSYSILWNAPDSIRVAYAGTETATFTSKNTEPAASAVFAGKLPEGSGTLYAIYPAASGNVVNADGSFSIAFKAEQEAVAGSYDPAAFPAVAMSESTDLSFQNVCGLLAISVYENDITEISVSDYTNVPLQGGTFTVSVDGEPVITAASEEIDAVKLIAPDGGVLVPGETYYVAMPPTSFPEGVEFTLTHKDGSLSEDNISGAGGPKVERSKVHAVHTLGVDPYSGYEYVDLGLPSGLKWATCNVGASSPEEYGAYFAWAETDLTLKSKYDKYSYRWWDSKNYRITKYNIRDWSSLSTADFDSDKGDGVEYPDYASYDYEDDPARQNMGGLWRSPNSEEFWELVDETDNYWTDNYNGTGVAGQVFVSKTNPDNFIFLPAAGEYKYNGNNEAGIAGKYWSCHVFFDSYKADFMFFNEEKCAGSYSAFFPEFVDFADAFDRETGRTVRAVVN